MIDAYICIGVWVVILIICIVELGKIENRMAEDEINKMFESLKNQEREITGRAGEKEKTEYEEQQGKEGREEGSGDPEA